MRDGSGDVSPKDAKATDLMSEADSNDGLASGQLLNNEKWYTKHCINAIEKGAKKITCKNWQAGTSLLSSRTNFLKVLIIFYATYVLTYICSSLLKIVKLQMYRFSVPTGQGNTEF